jgi:hypothetical protein
MRFRNVIVDFAPAILVAIAIGMLVAILTFGAIFAVTSKFALGLDFFIIVGVVTGGTLGICSTIMAFKMIRFRMSN